MGPRDYMMLLRITKFIVGKNLNMKFIDVWWIICSNDNSGGDIHQKWRCFCQGKAKERLMYIDSLHSLVKRLDRIHRSRVPAPQHPLFTLNAIAVARLGPDWAGEHFLDRSKAAVKKSSQSFWGSVWSPSSSPMISSSQGSCKILFSEFFPLTTGEVASNSSQLFFSKMILCKRGGGDVPFNIT